jgi:hypothetical protein
MTQAPRNIPEELRDAYTLNGEIPVFDFYFNDVVKTNSIVWSNEYIESFLKRFTFENIENNKHGQETYQNGALMHVWACKKYKDALVGKDIAVIGSQTPWIEAILINTGAKSVTTVEYNKPVCSHSILKTITYDDFTASDVQYDAIFTYSSIEHSGLGRYGDPLNPNGDIETMEHIYRTLKPGGYCFLGMPIGKDELSWNAHRVYGEKRLKLLYLDKFKELEWIGYSKTRLVTSPIPTKSQIVVQPVIVLQK